MRFSSAMPSPSALTPPPHAGMRPTNPTTYAPPGGEKSSGVADGPPRNARPATWSYSASTAAISSLAGGRPASQTMNSGALVTRRPQDDDRRSEVPVGLGDLSLRFVGEAHAAGLAGDLVRRYAVEMHDRRLGL